MPDRHRAGVFLYFFFNDYAFLTHAAIAFLSFFSSRRAPKRTTAVLLLD
jgi:hypothetical protein